MAKDPNGRSIQQDLVDANLSRLLKSTSRIRGRNQIIGPGLAVQTEINSGERRIIDYLSDPVTHTIDEAERERYLSRAGLSNH